MHNQGLKLCPFDRAWPIYYTTYEETEAIRSIFSVLLLKGSIFSFNMQIFQPKYANFGKTKNCVWRIRPRVILKKPQVKSFGRSRERVDTKMSGKKKKKETEIIMRHQVCKFLTCKNQPIKWAKICMVDLWAVYELPYKI